MHSVDTVQSIKKNSFFQNVDIEEQIFEGSSSLSSVMKLY